MRCLFALVPLALTAVALAQSAPEEAPDIVSRVDVTAAGERILVQEVLIDVPVSKVWEAHTTNEGWASWSSPVVDIDLRVGGTIRTHYDTTAELGDEGTNTLHVINYVPERLLTLRADVSKNWPEVMKQDGDKLSNVILFEALAEDRTRLVSYGIGYRDTPEYDGLMQFFIRANEGLYRKLIDVLEE